MSRRIFSNPLVKKRLWYHIDAKGMVVGRLADKVATLLQGKYKPVVNKSVDTGDFVVVTNVDKVQFTGNKWRQKLYRWHTGYPGGLKEVPAWRMHERRPERVIEAAVSGMLPKNRLRKDRLRRLKLYTGDEHLHQAQLAHQQPLPDHLHIPIKEKQEKELTKGWIITYEDLGDSFQVSGEKIEAPESEKKAKRKAKSKTWAETSKQYDTLVGPPPGWEL
eukprot:TRINITY_DN14124_c0_g1_i1.p2 TRINITY_DN14124_c0_g1~~TRINITY_DN14124_c0_g1_i1.p2  ORF type:complete len:219 (-),score=54.73 TRINITY_DN14124_c0_g1_i1:108-764(-)